MKKQFLYMLISLLVVGLLSCSPYSARKRVPLILNGVKILTYPTSESLEPTDDILDYIYSASFHLEDNPSVYVNIIGHSDNSGSYEQNISTAIKRAEKCYNYLVELGIEKYRIIYSGMGNMSPISKENTDEARAKNRRVEIKFFIRE
ncbi:MAG: OmpA family protein [bacterium]